MSTPKHFSLRLAGGRKPSGGAPLKVHDPGAQDQVVATLDTASLEDVVQALDAAEAARTGWAAEPPNVRAGKLLAVADALEGRADEISRWITLENGKPLAQSRGEVTMAADHFRWFAGETRRIYGRVVPSLTAEKRHMVLKAPIGVVGAISPWNFPLALAVRKIAPALAAGCPVVHKPASATPVCALLLAECIWQSGIGDSIFQVVPGDPRLIAGAMIDHPACRKITFTGSTEIGIALAQKAARTLTKLSLELGGNAPLLVFADADLDLAVEEALKAKYRNTGQSCIAANRILIESSIYDKFADRFVQRVQALRTGHGLENGIDIGAMINRRAIEDAEEIVRLSVEAGAKLLQGGTAVPELPGHFFAPTVLGDVPNHAPCLHKEVFAPIAPLCRFESEQEAIVQANNTEYGLSAYVFTNNLARAWRVAEALEAGTVGVNDGVPTVSHCPFGGYKSSGLGRELGSEGIDAFLETKHISFLLGSI